MAVLYLFLGFIIYLILMMAIIAVHELGHLVVGRLVGLRCRRFKVGPFQLLRGASGWRPSMDDDWQSGLVEHLIGPDIGTRIQWIAVLLGGCAANLVLAAILLGYVLSLPMQVQQAGDWTQCVFGVAMFSALIGLLNLVPFRIRGRLASDGPQLWHLCRSNAAFEEFRSRWKAYQAELQRYEKINKMTRHLAAGGRPRDWEGDRVRSITALRDGTQAEAIASYYAYLWAADCWAADNVEQTADEFLDRALALREMEPGFGDALFLEQAFWTALYGQDATAARNHLARAGAGHQGISEYWRAVAAISVAEGQHTEAEDAAQRAHELLSPNDYSERILLDIGGFSTKVCQSQKELM